MHADKARIMTPGHGAQKVFLDDVENTWTRIRTRTREIIQNQQQEGVEQIQLQAVEPGTEIMVQIPQEDSLEEIEQQAYAAFARFPADLQAAMATRELGQINEVLGQMKVADAEVVVEQMSEHGMLSMERGVIDGTTEEGKRQVQDLERAARTTGNVSEDEIQP